MNMPFFEWTWSLLNEESKSIMAYFKSSMPFFEQRIEIYNGLFQMDLPLWEICLPLWVVRWLTIHRHDLSFGPLSHRKASHDDEGLPLWEVFEILQKGKIYDGLFQI